MWGGGGGDGRLQKSQEVQLHTAFPASGWPWLMASVGEFSVLRAHLNIWSKTRKRTIEACGLEDRADFPLGLRTVHKLPSCTLTVGMSLEPG